MAVITATVFLLLSSHLLVRGYGECSSGDEVASCRETKRFASKDFDVQEILDELEVTFRGVKKSCGELCDTDADHERLSRETGGGIWSRELEKEVDCRKLFENKNLDAASKFPTPQRKIPNFMLDDFTYQGRVPVDYSVGFDGTLGYDGSPGRDKVVWTEHMIEKLVSKYRAGDLKAGQMYRKKDVANILRHLREHMGDTVRGKHVLVIGSQAPWVESLLLLEGAANVTTLEYNGIESRHPRVRAMQPREMAQQFLRGTLPQFDAMVSFSSIEHSGLGRYGDQLNPFGDIITMGRAWCVLKPGGRALVGVPVHKTERIKFNAARFYGRVMIPHLFANWRKIHTEADPEEYDKTCDWCYQPLFVAEKPI